MEQFDEQASDGAGRDRALGLMAAAFILDLVSPGLARLEPLDALLVMAINQANIARLTREPEARNRYAGLGATAPDHERRPVSINAVAGSLRIPFETARRRVRRLEAAGVCVATPAGLIIPEAFLISPAYLQSMAHTHERLRLFHRQAARADLLGALPDPVLPLQDAVPARASMRPLADYVLRSSDLLLGLAGDLVSVLILLGALTAQKPMAVAALARSLAAPPETVRRHVVRLVADGRAVRLGRGITVTPQMLETPPWQELFRDTAANTQRLFAALAERGVVEAWSRTGGQITERA